MEETCEYENLFLSYSNYKLLDWGSNIHYISHSKKKNIECTEPYIQAFFYTNGI